MLAYNLNTTDNKTRKNKIVKTVHFLGVVNRLNKDRLTASPDCALYDLTHDWPPSPPLHDGWRT